MSGDKLEKSLLLTSHPHPSTHQRGAASTVGPASRPAAPEPRPVSTCRAPDKTQPPDKTAKT
ncbi:hypothetical protein JYU34_016234 [Plutella xylostella]|uniref:Uncharacterized protein n=1 Tax=Plutella xylostella TaxID=51655 RepID=A0ABQ7Q257_PLUXY|nr:hypothetical protein JYU34_016234 [Plutella xylostella]